MCIFEYDEEKHMRHEREVWKNEGIEIGREKGRKEGHADADRETAERMIKDGEMSLEKIARYLPSLTMDELEEIKAKVIRLA